MCLRLGVNSYYFFSKLFQETEMRVVKNLQFATSPKAIIWYEYTEQNVSSDRIRRFKGYDFVINHPLLAWFRKTLIPQTFRDAVKIN